MLLNRTTQPGASPASAVPPVHRHYPVPGAPLQPQVRSLSADHLTFCSMEQEYLLQLVFFSCLFTSILISSSSTVKVGIPLPTENDSILFFLFLVFSLTLAFLQLVDRLQEWKKENHLILFPVPTTLVPIYF